MNTLRSIISGANREEDSCVLQEEEQAKPDSCHRFSVWDFHRMGEYGILNEEDRVELLDGRVFDMMPIGPFHSSLVTDISLLLHENAAKRWWTRVQNPVTLNDHSQVQPDIALVAPRDHRYRESVPGPADVFLIIEVADTSLDYDKTRKLPRYAHAGITEVWIVNVPERQVEIFRQPNFLAYERKMILRPGDRAVLAAFPDVSIAVAELFA